MKNAEATATAEAISQLDGVKSATDVVADALDSNCVVGEVIREWLVIVYVILVLVLVLVLVCFGYVDFSCRVDIKVAHFVVEAGIAVGEGGLAGGRVGVHGGGHCGWSREGFLGGFGMASWVWKQLQLCAFEVACDYSGGGKLSSGGDSRTGECQVVVSGRNGEERRVVVLGRSGMFKDNRSVPLTMTADD